MALSKNVNSYATVAEASSYFEDRLDAAAWTDAPDLQKAQALVTATAMLDELQWAGCAVSGDQPLAFPRVLFYFDPRVGSVVHLTNTVPARVITATYEQAYHLLNNDGLLDSTGGVTDLSVGTIQLSSIKAPSALSPVAKKLITPLLAKNGATSWWRAN